MAAKHTFSVAWYGRTFSSSGAATLLGVWLPRARPFLHAGRILFTTGMAAAPPGAASGVDPS